MKIAAFFLLIITTIETYGSDTTRVNLRQKLFFTAGIEMVLPPKYGEAKIIYPSYLNFDQKQQITGQKLKLGFGFKMFKERLFLRHSISVKYGHIYYKNQTIDSTFVYPIGYNKSIRGFTFDQTIDMIYPIRLKKISLSPIVGYTWINMASEYHRIQSMNNLSLRTETFALNGFVLGISISKESFELTSTIILVGNNSVNYPVRSNIYIPTLGFYYHLNREL